MTIEQNPGLAEGEKHFVGNYLRHMYATKETGDEDKEKIIQDCLAYMDTLTKDVQQQIVEATLPDFLIPKKK